MYLKDMEVAWLTSGSDTGDMGEDGDAGETGLDGVAAGVGEDGGDEAAGDTGAVPSFVGRSHWVRRDAWFT